MKEMYFPLRYRLSLFHLLLLIILLSVFSYAIFFGTKNYLIQNTAVSLRAQAKPVIEKWLHSGSGDTDYLKSNGRFLIENLGSRDTSVMILNASGKPMKPDGDFVLSEAAYYRQSLSGDNEVRYITEKNGSPSLVVLIPLRKVSDPSEVMGVVRLSTPLAPLERILARQKLILMAGIILTVFAGALIGFWITTVSLKELSTMVQTCNDIAGGNLTRRINLPRDNDEIGQLAKAFDNMITRIENLFTAQSRFVANAAHELRTPMAALQGSLEVLMRGAQDDRDSFLRLTRGMYREITRLSRMSEQLLDLTKIETSDVLHKTTIDVKKFIAEFVQYSQVIAEERTLVCDGESGLHITVDSDVLKQVLFNLTDNAIQHTESSGTIQFSWKLTGMDINIRVSDDGCGIDPASLPHIFDPFFRGDSSRSRVRGGTGLGLTIVKKLVELNGGRISADSISREGTVFTLVFPSSRI